MCLLDGSVGGVIPAATQFHIREQANGETVKVPIYQIIQQVVNHWGGEQLGKILISDLKNEVPYGMRWTLKNPLYRVIISNDQDYFCLSEDQANKRMLESENSSPAFIKIQQGHDVGFINSVFACCIFCTDNHYAEDRFRQKKVINRSV